MVTLPPPFQKVSNNTIIVVVVIVIVVEKGRRQIMMVVVRDTNWDFIKAFTVIRTIIRVSLKTQNVSQRAPNGGYAVPICGGPLKKFQIFISIFDRMRNTFVAGYDSALL